jgi:hypothetical protein
VALANALVDLGVGMCDKHFDNGATQNNWLLLTPQSNVFNY